MFEDFNLKNKDYKYLLIITVLSTVLVGYYINFNLNIGTYCSDVYIYLLNALYYTGTTIHYPENIYLSPVICYLTSILFRLGFVDKISILIVTGAFAIAGNIGLYILLKRYFNDLLSFTGVVIYSTLSLNLMWLANGSLDIPAVSITIWIALIGIIAIKDNGKYYRYIFLLMVLGFYTRYTVLLVLPPLVMYYVYENGFRITRNDIKEILIGFILGVLLFALITNTIYDMSNGEFLLTEQFTARVESIEGHTLDPAYNPDTSYYLKNILNFISNSKTGYDGNPVLENPTVLSYITALFLCLASAIWLKDNTCEINVKNKIIPFILFIVAILSFDNTSSTVTIIITLLGLYLLGKDSDYKVAYFMLGWILANIIFFSEYDIKVNRYIIPIFPAFIYFILRSLDIIQSEFNFKRNILPALLIVLFIVQGFAFTLTFTDTGEFKAPEDISDYIISNNENYENMEIGAYNMRPYLWYLGYNVTGIENNNTPAIDASNVSYYISEGYLNNSVNYTEIEHFNQLYLYEKN